MAEVDYQVPSGVGEAARVLMGSDHSSRGSPQPRPKRSQHAESAGVGIQKPRCQTRWLADSVPNADDAVLDLGHALLQALFTHRCHCSLL